MIHDSLCILFSKFYKNINYSFDIIYDFTVKHKTLNRSNLATVSLSKDFLSSYKDLKFK